MNEAPQEQTEAARLLSDFLGHDVRPSEQDDAVVLAGIPESLIVIEVLDVEA